MVEKLLVLFLLYGIILGGDGPKLKKRSGRERFLYGLLIAASLYPSLAYLLDKDWPSLDNGVQFIMENPAKRIVEAIKLPSE